MTSLSWRTGTRAVALAMMLVLLMAVPALAHPFIRGGEAPVDSLVTLTLAMAHGCGTEQAGGGDPTREVAMEVPEPLRIVEVPAKQGWEIAFETLDDSSIAVVVWTATTAEEPAPEFVFDAVFSGAAGDEVYLRVFQECDGFAYRWIGTPDEPATDPAIRVLLTAADPSSPPPPDEVPPIAPAERDGGEELSGGPAPGESAEAQAQTGSEVEPEKLDAISAPEAGEQDDQHADDEAGAAMWLAGVAALVLVGLVVAGLRTRRSRS
ncbi:MAG: DUF1775 domain-containing protein [Nitriliruptoraceae bacterium]